MIEISKIRTVHDVEELEDVLSEPNQATVEAMGALDGDLVVLGIGGKMGPTLARMAKRASDLAGVRRRIIGVSRFSGSPALQDRLHAWGIETHACDLLNAHSYGELPDAPNVMFMAGMKFGSTGHESMTWAMNAFVPGLVAERYRDSRISVFSTGNVYGLTPVQQGGAVETDSLFPVGEYALSCLGRERIFEHFSRANKTPMAILRLNYAVELRYGVLLDVAEAVYSGKPVGLEMGYFNAIWQADASAIALRSLHHASSPPFVLNITGPEILSVASIATEFGCLFGKPALLEGAESADALLSNSQKCVGLFGRPDVGIGEVLPWIAEWVARDGEKLGKPTHFENRSGNF